MRIRDYRDGDGEAVRALILGIQRGEFGVPVTIDDQPDLLDIPGFYQTGSGLFHVAEDDGRIVGTIALRDYAPGRVALRKMFVAATHRGSARGVAQALLDGAIAHCRTLGLRDIHLGTVDVLKAAHRFYEKNGFQRIEKTDLPAEFPLVAVDTRFYRLPL